MSQNDVKLKRGASRHNHLPGEFILAPRVLVPTLVPMISIIAKYGRNYHAFDFDGVHCDSKNLFSSFFRRYFRRNPTAATGR